MNKRDLLNTEIDESKLKQRNKKYNPPKAVFTPLTPEVVFGHCGQNTQGCKAKNKQF